MNHPTQEQFDEHLTAKSFVRPRRAIQIAAINHPESQGGLFVLCDDGSIWQRDYGGSAWSQEPDIPAFTANFYTEPPAERRDCDEPILGVPRG